MNWPSRTATLVTGAASGIGLGVARALVASGASVALVDIDADRLDTVAKELTDAGGNVVALPFDISETDGWESLADRAEQALGPISLVCNIAGVNGGGTTDNTPLDVWRWVFKVNTEAQFAAAATFIPRFKQRGGRAHIMNTASISGLVPIAGVPAYTSSKFASVGLTLVMREELKDTEIGVSLLIPGAVATRINYSAAEAGAKRFGGEPDLELAKTNTELLNKGADPDRVGEQVVEALRARQTFIVTHREWGRYAARVAAEIEAAFEEFDGRHGPEPVIAAMEAGRDPVTT